MGHCESSSPSMQKPEDGRRLETISVGGYSSLNRTKSLWMSVFGGGTQRRHRRDFDSCVLLAGLEGVGRNQGKVGGCHGPDVHDACEARAGGSDTRSRLHSQQF